MRKVTYKNINDTLNQFTSKRCVLRRIGDSIYLETFDICVDMGQRYLYNLTFKEWIERCLLVYFVMEKIMSKTS